MTNYYLVFAENPQLVPGTHVLWSLAVEEHYYLLFPFLFSILAAKNSYVRMASILIILCAMVLLWRCYLVFGLGIYQPHTYMATDARLDSIIFGCIMGVVYNPVLDKIPPIKQTTEIIVLIVSVIVLFFCFHFRSQEFRETFRYTLQGLALFPIFHLAIRKNHWLIFAPLNWKPIAALGTISYTFYLFHPTAIIMANRTFGNQLIKSMVFSFVITTLFSTLMYFLVEKKFAALRKKLHSDLDQAPGPTSLPQEVELRR
ncbi:MAG: acyltransferase [Gammaproteobacteria bacterium]|nr:acyltransferase [Gammaproteobacteria bacterium]